MSQPQDDQQNQQMQQQPQQQPNQQLMQQQVKHEQVQDQVQQQVQQQLQQQVQQQQVQQQNQQQVMQAGQIQQVQVIQNQQYLQQLYSGQGGLIMQPGNMQIAPMKVITQGQPGTYPTYPGTQNQTLVIGQLFSPQQNLLPAQQGQAKPQEIKPPTQGCVVSSQAQQLTSQPQLTHLISPTIQYTNNGRATVQSIQGGFSPWQFNTLPQGITWASQPPILAPPNSIFIRGTQQDGSGQNQQGGGTPMFVQQPPPPQQIQGHPQVGMQQGTALPQIATTPTPIKTRPEHIQPKTMNTMCRPLMPNSVRGTPPLNSAQGTPGPKKRTKQVVVRGIGGVVLSQKMMDASNQTKLQTSIHQQMSGNNKMIIASTGQIIHPQQQLITSMASQQQQQQQLVQASLGQHMGPNTQLTYTTNSMQQGPPQPQFGQQTPPQQKQLVGFPMQAQQIVAPQLQLPQPTPPQQQQPLHPAQPPSHPELMSLPVQQQIPSSQQQSLPPSSLAHSLGPPAPSATLVETSSASITLPLSNNSHLETSHSNPLAPPPTSESSPLPPTSNLTPLAPLSTAESEPPLPSPKEKTTQLTPSGPLPKSTALVKPQILTHVIEGFVIQESDQPFPVNRAACFGDLMDREENGEPLSKKMHLSDDTPAPTPSSLSDDKDTSAKVATGTPASGVPNPIKWTVTEVCDFIRNLPGCAEYVEDFAMQEIDGQALMLLQDKHLMETMSMKLGPALKIVAKIDSMRQAAGQTAPAPSPAPVVSSA